MENILASLTSSLILDVSSDEEHLMKSFWEEGDECNALLGQEEHHRNNAMEIQSSFCDLRCTSSKYLLGYIPMDLGCLLTYPGHHGSLVKSRLLMFPKRIKSPLPITIASGGQAIFICPILRFAEHPTAKTEGSIFGYRIFKPVE